MRYPLNGTIFVTNPHGEPGYGHFGKHAGLDLRASVGTPFYAPEDGVINKNYTGKSGTKVLGLASPKYWHRFLHIDRAVVKVGERVKEGQLLGYTGNTGNVPAHLHWDIRKPNIVWNASYANYYDPKTLLTSATPPKPQGEEIKPQGEEIKPQGEEIMNEGDVTNMYRVELGRDPDPGGLKNYTGKPWKTVWYDITGSKEWKDRQAAIAAESANLRQQVADLSKTIDAQNKQN